MTRNFFFIHSICNPDLAGLCALAAYTTHGERVSAASYGMSCAVIFSFVGGAFRVRVSTGIGASLPLSLSEARLN